MGLSGVVGVVSGGNAGSRVEGVEVSMGVCWCFVNSLGGDSMPWRVDEDEMETSEGV